MGLDYFNCNVCEEIYCDSGEYMQCQKCRTSFCEDCCDKYHLKYCNSEIDIINCPICNGTEITKNELKEWMYKKLGLSKDEIHKKALEEKNEQ